jgi:hypothetical protein
VCVEVRAVLLDFGERGRGVRDGQEREVVAGRSDGVQRGQLAAKALEEFGPRAAELRLADDAVSGGDALDAADDGEGLANHLEVIAEPERLGSGDARLEDGAGDGELFVAGAAFGQAAFA